MAEILALDLANKTGWALSPERSGTHNFHFAAEEVLGARVSRCHAWVFDLTADEPVEAIYYEQSHMRGGPATRSAMALICAVEMFAYDHRIPVYPVHTGTLKLHATGDGKAKKPDMVSAAIDAFSSVEVVDDNHADALWLWDYAQNQPRESI